jgi:aspartyl-tRNA(Asn)/glutamyl-tRNA(Gln) amidotransferase subunit B
MSAIGDGWEAVIGLEIHVQLRTRTKMFCGCEVSFGDEPNVHTCPVCLAHPGTLPVPNEQAIRYALMIAAALDCEVAPRSIFHRKNYFYPDIPKGYQISQYDNPIAGRGRLGDVRIERAHLEEDTAKMIHVGESGRIQGSSTSLVDFNRAGTPLMEIVTEPDIRSAEQARSWAQLLRETLRQIGVSDVNMEQGSLRVDANVSVRRAGAEELGTKAELKNMNSFRFLERGIDAELERQVGLLEAGEELAQETLHFDPRSGALTPLRSKEYAHDYRYLPEPDLVAVAPTDEMLRAARESLPELPAAREARYRDELGLPDAAAAQLAADTELGAYFERALAAGDGTEARTIANWVTGELAARVRDAGEGGVAESKVEPEALAALVAMVESREVTHGAGREVLSELVASGGDPVAIVESKGLGAVSDAGELGTWVDAAIEANPEAAEQVRAGNPKAIGPIVGAVMREAKGRADGGEVTRLIHEKLRPPR